jgi:hypothetical protein
MRGRPFQIGNIPWNKGESLSKVHREKISNNHSRYWLGKKLSSKTKKKMSIVRKGELASNWQGGITPLHFRIRKIIEFKAWKRKVFKRDNWICQNCGIINTYFEAHHIKSFSKIYRQFLEKYNQFSPFEDQETLIRLATKYQPFWDVDNGKTLCVDCHKITNNYKKKALKAIWRGRFS